MNNKVTADIKNSIRSFRSLLSYCLKCYAELPIMICSTGAVTYYSFIENVRRYCAYALKQHASFIAIDLSSPVEYAAAYLGVVLSRHVACLISEDRARVFWGESCAVISDSISCLIKNETPVALHDIEDGDPYTPCTAALSSGTSAEPKCILLSQRGILASALYGGEQYGFWEGERLVHVLPYWHLFGLAADLIAPMTYGACVCMPDSPIGFFSTMKKYKPNSVSIPPALAFGICKAIGRVGSVEAVTGGSLQKVLVAGAALDLDTSQKLLSYGVTPCTAYGMTECSPCISISSPNDCYIGTVGKPIGCMEVHIADDGEITVRGENVMVGYLNDERATKEKIRDGWLHTGDIGCFDSAGNLVITGRKSNMLVFSNGFKCIPEAIEAKISELPFVDESLLASSTDDCHAILTVVSDDPEKVDRASICAIMSEAGLSVYELKIKTERLKKTNWERCYDDMTVEELITIVKECVECDKNTIDLRDRLKEDLMMTSFSMMMLVVKTEEKMGLSVDERLLAEAKTIQDLLDIINGTVKE